MVDSGAHGTLLPKSEAGALGLDAATDLIETPEGSGGAGGTTFATWTTIHAISGQILAMLPDGPQLWGPVIQFKPVFAEGAHALLGRQDFFKYFSITFVNDPTHGAVFHLDY
jgi:hypothetical protein